MDRGPVIRHRPDQLGSTHKKREELKASVELISHGCQEPHQRALASVIEKTINGSQGRGHGVAGHLLFKRRKLLIHPN
ncbi:hypothetical protein OUZ56_007512 [Daphnia magna]|uniref:Uncharacterized protein n=1 Tax=Daphnia magna TaxID=35525 RepID=A0ABR0AA59_9CRUS|nr:hypothetical protein OUZ56_007512 [Daphnia magna]